MSTFIAQYKGQCVWCLEPIAPGDECQFWRKKLYHVECKREAYTETIAAKQADDFASLPAVDEAP